MPPSVGLSLFGVEFTSTTLYINVYHSYHSSHWLFVTFKGLKTSFGFQQLGEKPWPDPAVLLLKKKNIACQPGH